MENQWKIIQNLYEFFQKPMPLGLGDRLLRRLRRLRCLGRLDGCHSLGLRSPAHLLGHLKARLVVEAAEGVQRRPQELQGLGLVAAQVDLRLQQLTVGLQALVPS